MKSDIQSSEGLVQIKWASTKECDNPSKYETELMFHPGDLRKTYLTSCQISSQKKKTPVQFLEKRFLV